MDQNPEQQQTQKNQGRDKSIYVSPHAHRSFKVSAVSAGYSLKEAAEEAFADWQNKQQHG